MEGEVMDLQMKKIKDITIGELYSNCPIVKCGEIAQCARDCDYSAICHKLPPEGAFEAAMEKVSGVVDDADNCVEEEDSCYLESQSQNYDSHSIIIDHVENLTINM